MNRVKTIGLLVTAIVVVAVVVAIILLLSSGFELVAYKNKDMEPTISQNETIVISKHVDNIKRGDIIIFKYPGDQSQMFVKRVVGLPGELIAIREGRLFVGRESLDESYLDGTFNKVRRSVSESQIPAGSYYVLGDNRDASNDSRMWGPLSAELIYGKVMFK
jgi:signal peptidase I